MHSRLKIEFVLILLCLGRLGEPHGRASDNGDGTFTYPVLNADYPDCDVIRVGDFNVETSEGATANPLVSRLQVSPKAFRQIEIE
jgi:hypothetical protein